MVEPSDGFMEHSRVCVCDGKYTHAVPLASDGVKGMILVLECIYDFTCSVPLYFDMPSTG